MIKSFILIDIQTDITNIFLLFYDYSTDLLTSSFNVESNINIIRLGVNSCNFINKSWL